MRWSGFKLHWILFLCSHLHQVSTACLTPYSLVGTFARSLVYLEIFYNFVECSSRKSVFFVTVIVGFCCVRGSVSGFSFCFSFSFCLFFLQLLWTSVRQAKLGNVPTGNFCVTVAQAVIDFNIYRWQPANTLLLDRISSKTIKRKLQEIASKPT